MAKKKITKNKKKMAKKEQKPKKNKKMKYRDDNAAKRVVKKLSSMFSAARKAASKSKGMDRTKAQIDMKLAQRLDSAGFSEIAQEISDATAPKENFFKRFFAGFAARPLGYKIGVIGGGFMSALVLFTVTAFILIWYRGMDVPILRGLFEEKPPILSMTKAVETEYGVGIEDNEFIIKAATGTTFRTLGVANKISVSPRFEYEIDLSDDNSSINVVPKSDLQPGTEYTITLRKGTMFSDGSSLPSDFTWVFKTEPNFTVTGITPRDGSQGAPMDTAIEVEFTYKDLDVEDFNNYFEMTPRTDGRFELYGKNIVFLPSRPLVGGSRYRITVKKGFKNSRGDELPQDYTSEFITGYDTSSSSEVVIPYMGWSERNPLLSVSQDLWIGVLGSNINTPIQYTVYKTNESALLTGMADFDWDIIDKPADTDLTQISQFSLVISQSEFFRIDFDDYGIYFIEAYNQEFGRSIYKYVIYSPIGAIWADSFDSESVWVFDMNQKEPVSGAKAEFFNLKNSTSPIGSSETDGSGHASIDKGSADYVVVNSSGNYAVAFAESYSRIYNWFGGPGLSDFLFNDVSSRAYIYTDRPLYRPGDTVNFKAIIRDENDFSYSIPGGKSVTVRVGEGGYFWNSMQSLPLFEETYVVSSDFGTVTGSFVLPRNANSSSENISVLIGDQVVDSQNFMIAEYTKPKYLFEMNVDKSQVFSGERVNVEVVGTDYSGDPASGVSVKLGTYRGEIDRVNWIEDYDELMGYTGYGGGEDLGDINITLDQNGRATHSFTSGIPGYGSNLGSYNLYLWSQTDYNDYDSDQVLVAEDNTALFAKPERYSIEENEDNKITFRSVNLWGFEGKGGVRILVNNVTRNWTEWVQTGTYYDPGTKSTRPVYDSVMHSEVVLSDQEITSNTEGYADLQLNDLEQGWYDIDATFYDDRGIYREFEDLFYVYSPPEDGGFLFEDAYSRYDKYAIYTDKEEYEVGDTADITIKTSLEGKGVYMVQRGDVYDWKIVDLSSGMVSIQQEITNEMSPQVEFCIWGVDEFTSEENPEIGLASQYLTNVFESSCAYIPVYRDYGKLSVDVTLDKNEYKPGDKVKMDVRVKDNRDKGVAAEVSIDVVDKALLDLMKYMRNEDYGIYYNFYDRINQMASVMGSMTRYQYSEGGYGAGGMGDTGVRDNFADAAYWNGRVTTDTSGRASVEFTLPDNLTTWVARVVAVTGDTWVGESTSEFKARKDISLDAKMPKMLREGDKWDMDLEVKNYSGSQLDADLRVSCDGCKDTSWKKSVSVGSGNRQVQKFTIEPDGSSDELEIEASLNSGSNTLDGVKWSMPVISEGLITADTYTIYQEEGVKNSTMEFEIPDSADIGRASLELSFTRSFVNENALISVDPTIASSIDLSSSIIHNSIFVKYYNEIAPTEKRSYYEEIINSAVEMLRSNQADSGGFGWFDYDAINYEVSAYVGIALGRAVDAGAIEEDSMYSNLELYLWENLKSDDRSPDERILGIYALATMGDSDALPYALWMKKTPEDYSDSPLNIAHLMLALQELGGFADAGELVPMIEDLADESGRAATWEDPDTDFRVLNSVDYTTAIVYQAISGYEQSTLKEKARNWLVDNPVPVYGNSVESVGTFYALTVAEIDNVAARKGVNKVTVKVNGKAISTFDVGGDEDWIGKKNLTVDSKYLKEGKNKVKIERSGSGSLYTVGNLSYYSTKLDDEKEFEMKRFIKDFNTGATVNTVKKGQVVTIRTEVKVDRDGYNLVVNDFLPAGFEPVQYEIGNYDYNFISKWWKWGQDWDINRYGSVGLGRITFEEYKVDDGKVYVFEFPAVAAYTGKFSAAGSQSYLLGFDDINGYTLSGDITVKE